MTPKCFKDLRELDQLNIERGEAGGAFFSFYEVVKSSTTVPFLNDARCSLSVVPDYGPTSSLLIMPVR